MGGRGSSGAKGGAESWSLARVGRLQSGNEPGLTVAQEYRQKETLGRYSANDHERARRAGFDHPREYQASITEHIRQHGILNPAQSSHGTLDEGYHRYAAMRQLGKRSMRIRETG
jgi:hypothetical protein